MRTVAQKQSLEELALLVRPATVISIDVELPLSPLQFDGTHLDAWVIVRRGGHPRGLRVIDVTQDDAQIENQLKEFVAPFSFENPETIASDRIADETLPLISIVIPTIAERLEDLASCLESLTAQDYPKFEVILVDNRRSLPSPDPLVDICQRWPAVSVLREPTPGISAARNCGVNFAKGGVIAFTDDDVVTGDDWLRQLGEAFVNDPDVDVVTGLILPAELETPAQLWFEHHYGGFAGERTFEPLIISVRAPHSSRMEIHDGEGNVLRRVALYGGGAFGAGANMAFRASSLDSLGGFDEALGTGTPARGGEDLAALMSILWDGGRWRYVPNAYVYHRHRREIEQLLNQLDGYGVGFTAVMTSLVLRDPLHIMGFVKNIPFVARQIFRELAGKMKWKRSIQPVNRSLPPVLARLEFRGYFRGPAAYFSSRREHSRAVS